jgi:hypothetical protein
MSVSKIDALLYKAGRSPSDVERALRIPALSVGWRGSFQALLAQDREGRVTGNAGLTAAGSPPAWVGSRLLRIAQKVRESKNVVSLTFEPTDGRPLAAALPGQFVVLHLKPAPDAPASIRSYSLSGEPGALGPLVEIARALGRLCHSLTVFASFLLTPIAWARVSTSSPLALNVTMAAGGTSL